MEQIIEIISKDNNSPMDLSDSTLPIKNISVSKIYYLKGELSKTETTNCIDLLFKDHLMEKSKIHPVQIESKKATKISPGTKSSKWEVEVFYKKEVTDPATSYILKAMKDIDIIADNIRTGRRFVVKGNLTYKQIDQFSRRFLANLIVQDIFIKNL